MIALFALSFFCFARPGKNWGTTLIPVAVLVYLLLFFPNSPAARLSPQEVYTAFFLGMCTLSVALTLMDEPNRYWFRSNYWRYALFILGYAGVISSKETNISGALWLLLVYIAWAITGTRKRRKIAGAMPLILILAFTTYRLQSASSTYDRLTSPFDYAWKILSGLFQIETSLAITVVFSLLFSVVIARTIVNVLKQQCWKESLFILFLFGQVTSLLVSLVLFSPIQALRYWFIMLPGFVLLLAFSSKYIVLYAQRFSIRAFAASGFLILAFTVFFTAVNYYHFSFHTFSQYRGRTLEESTLHEVSRLLDNREYVYSLFLGANEYDYAQSYYFAQYLPFFRGEYSGISWKGWPTVVNFAAEENVISAHPSRNYPHPSYLVDYEEPAIERSLLQFLDVHSTFWGQRDSAFLSLARRVAQLLQAGTPFVEIDAGAPEPDYHSTIYRVPFGYHEDRIIDVFRGIHAGATSNDPVIRSFFDIHIVDDLLVYVREQCAPEDRSGVFVLHLTPMDIGNLPDDRAKYGFHNLDFHFGEQGVSFEGRCVAAVQIPDYAIANIHTGQYTEEGTSWSIDFKPGLIGSLREAWERVIISTPVVRSTFDLYLLGQDLIYVREQCAPSDTIATFFLHMVPFSLDDLHADRREYGFDNLDFRFATRGASFDGRCVASVRLPDYAIASIRTGQYAAGGQIWSVEFAPDR